MFFFLKKKYRQRKENKPLSIKYYYETLINLEVSRDPITGIYGMDIHEPWAMIMWVIPGSQAEKMGFFPKDLIYAIDGIKVYPGDNWYQKYLL